MRCGLYNNSISDLQFLFDDCSQFNIFFPFVPVNDDCKDKKCDFYAFCESDSAGGAKCVCPSSCVQVNRSITHKTGEG